MLKVTALYGHPTDTAQFERYYADVHLPIFRKMAGVERSEAARVVGTPDGSAPPYYRIFEFWLVSQEQLQRSLSSPEGQAVVSDLPNFASGGATVLISKIG